MTVKYAENYEADEANINRRKLQGMQYRGDALRVRRELRQLARL